jgi:hypothetical protein
MEFFTSLGSRVERRWRDENYYEQAFPEIASQALAEADALNAIDPWDIIRQVHTSDDLPLQQENEFSDLPLTMFRGPRFCVEVYYWLDGTTSLHQHCFSGAFQVLLGSSIHSQYSFENERKINSHFSVGDILLQDVQLLETGAISRIYSGRRFIHSLFHLDRPSVTLTVRTNLEADAQPQYDYLKPYFAVDPFYREPLDGKKVKSVMLLLRMNHTQADSYISELISTSDFQTAFTILREVFKYLNSSAPKVGSNRGEEKDRFARLLEITRRRHDDLALLLPPVFDEYLMKSRLLERRKYVKDYNHRFFLALLLNVPRRTDILQLVKQRFPQRTPVDTVCDWVQELFGIKMSRQSPMPTREPSSISPTNMGPSLSLIQMFVLRRLIEGFSLEQIKASAGTEHPGLDAQNLTASVEEAYRLFRNTILQPLFEPPPISHREIQSAPQVIA